MLKVQTTPIKPYNARKDIPERVTRRIPSPVEYSNKIAQVVALFQNSINEQEKKLAFEAVKFSKMMFDEDQHELNKSIEVAGIKAKIQAYKDCSEIVLHILQA